jgi:NAD(P)-dependent dehydrogenase (short-subunit alcohol dehydrogenase family)
VAPGIVDTDMIRAPRTQGAAWDAEASAAQLRELSALHPLGRLGTAAEVAEAIQYALEAPWLTGSVLTLDGGISLT